jgi:hypothetical protein
MCSHGWIFGLPWSGFPKNRLRKPIIYSPVKTKTTETMSTSASRGEGKKWWLKMGEQMLRVSVCIAVGDGGGGRVESKQIGRV